MHNPANIEYVPHGTTLTYQLDPRDTPTPITIGLDDVVGIVLDNDGSVLEWVSDDAPHEFLTNVATWGRFLALDWDSTYEPRAIETVRRERELFADCFGTV